MKYTIEYSEKSDRIIIESIFRQLKLGISQNLGILLFHEFKSNCGIPYAILPKLEDAETDIVVSNSEIEQFAKSWNEVKDELTKSIDNIFLDVGIENIVLHPTYYGLKSWHILTGDRLDVWLRLDFSFEQIIPSILEGFIYAGRYPEIPEDTKYSGKYYDYKNSVLYFLLRFTKLSRFIPEYKNLSEQMNVPELDEKLREESQNNYSRLGYHYDEVVSESNGRIFIYDKDVSDNLQPAQLKLLVLLLKNKGIYISFHDIAEELWTEEVAEKFSLTAITKAMHDLRKILRDLGIKKDVIFTKRKVGYGIFE